MTGHTTQDYSQASAYLAALGKLDTICDFRAIHDSDKTVPAIPRRGTLEQLWNELCSWNDRGYGIFVTPAQLDGQGRELTNVQNVVAHYVDLDAVNAAQMLTQAEQGSTVPTPHMVVQSSPNKFHVYWRITPHSDAERFTLVQRKLVTLFQSDPNVIDATRVMRLPGTLHCKAISNPQLVTVRQSTGWENDPTSTDVLDILLHGVEPAQGGHAGERRAIGEGEQAPSYADALTALQAIPVEQLTERNEWVSVTAAFMQSVPPDAIEGAKLDWLAWNMNYPGNEDGANLKLWNDTLKRGTSVKGWSTLHKVAYGYTPAQARVTPTGAPVMPGSATVPTMPAGDNAPRSEAAEGADDIQLGTMLFTAEECAQYFKGCFLIESEGEILTAKNTFMGSTKFNSAYGGKKFTIGADMETSGQITDEPWKAATRSRLWTVPKVDFTCFRPDLPQREIITDELGRTYVNMYRPATIKRRSGDPSPFLNHLEKILPVESDRAVLLAYMAHNVQFPGVKTLWAPLIQSEEGIGKNIIKYAMRHAMGRAYFYQPSAKNLNDSGAKFNGWMENKLFFMVDEIKTDEKREMVEMLKPFITETELEIQGKGKDQKMGDTPGNWLFFSNHKDAIPITRNSRRFAIFYSPLQSSDDILAAGMDKDYFDRLFDWMREGGAEIVADYLLRWDFSAYPLPKRAPVTSSTEEALSESRGWLEQFISECIEEERYGFRGGWVSSKMLAHELEQSKRTVATRTMSKALATMGYTRIGRMQLGTGHMHDIRPYVWSLNPNADEIDYAPAQGATDSIPPMPQS